MRTNTSTRTTPLWTLTCLLLLACSVLATAQEVRRVGTATQIGPLSSQGVDAGLTPATQIGTVIPQGKGFRVELNESQLSGLYAQYAASQMNARLAQPAAAKAEFRQSVQNDVLLKVRTLFPNGVPESAAKKVKITITVKLSKPPEIGLSIQW